MDKIALYLPIITINTWKCDGDYDQRLVLMLNQLKQLNPVIIACQECFKSDEAGADTLIYLADELAMNYYFLAGRLKKRLFRGKWIDSLSGLGILSKFPIENTASIQLAAVDEDEDRKALQVVLALPNELTLCLTNCHLTHLEDASDIRKLQAEQVADFAISKADCTYNLVCGDFNAELCSEAIAAFIQKARAIDTYGAGHGAELKYSLVEPFLNRKNICVDHIFALPNMEKKTYPKFVNSAIVLNTADENTGVFPSDHFGIYTELIIN